MGGVRRGSQERLHLIARFESSRLSVKEFAQREGIGVSTLHKWLRKQKLSQSPRIARVVQTGEISSSRRTEISTTMIVEIGRARIHLARDFSRDAFESIVDVLGERL